MSVHYVYLSSRLLSFFLVRSAIALLRKKHQSTPAVEGSTPRSTAVESEVQWLGFRELDVVVDKAKETGGSGSGWHGGLASGS